MAADPSEQYNLLDNYDIEELDDDEELMMLEDIDDLLSEKEREYDAVRNKIGELQVLKEEEERIRLEEEQRRNEEERIRLEKENNKKADEKVNDMKLDDVVVNNIPEEKPEIKQNQPEIKEDPKQEEKKNLEFEGEKVKDRNVDYAFAREYCKELQRYANYLEKTVRFYQFSNSEGFKHLQTALKPFKDMKFEGRDADLPLFPDDLAKKFDTVMAASAEYTLAHSNLDSFSPSQKERLKTCRRLDMLHDLFEKGIVLRGNRGYMKAQMAEKLVFNEAFNNLESKDPLKKAVAKQVLTKYDALKIKCNQNTAAVDEFVTALGPEHNKFKDLEKIVKIKGGKFNDKMKAFMKAKENAKQTEKKPVEINPMMK